MKKTLTAAFAAASMILAGATAPASALERLTIGTGPSGAIYNQIGTVLSSLYQEKTGTPGAARPYTGTTSYLPLVQTGEIEAGVLGGLESRDAYAGQGNFPQAMKNIRALMVVNRTVFQFFTRANDGMTTIADLKGKKVGVGAPGSGTEANFRQLLEAYGMTKDDVSGQYLSFSESAEAYKDKHIDAFIV
ncbi:MAG: TAXI family TRAP transporter solute-binding subunit, partial [Oricola sp.]